MRLWPRRKPKIPRREAPPRESPHIPDDQGVVVRDLTIEDLGDTTASLTLKEIMLAKAAANKAPKGRA